MMLKEFFSLVLLLLFSLSATDGLELEKICKVEIDSVESCKPCLQHQTAWRIWSGLGFCRGNSSLLEDLKDDFCVRSSCMYSEKAKINIDVRKLSSPLSSPNNVQWKADTSVCRAPPNSDVKNSQENHTISFIFMLRSEDKFSIVRALIESFISQHEVENGEFLVIDNRKSAEAIECVDHLIKNLRFFFDVPIKSVRVENEKNIISQALQLTTSDNLIFIENDVIVLPGSLSLLLQTFKTFKNTKIGIIGPMIVSPEGKVIEAGGIFYSNGGILEFTEPIRPIDLVANQARVVDYVGRGFLLVRREALVGMGNKKVGFNPLDICLEVLQNGFKIVYQSLAVAIRFKNINEIKQEYGNMKNRYEKYQDILKNYCPSGSDLKTDLINPHAGLSFSRRGKILFLDEGLPEPDRDAGSLRVVEILKLLVGFGFSVTFEASAMWHKNIRYLLPLLKTGIQVVIPGTLHEMSSYGITKFHNTLKKSLQICPWELIIISRRDIFTERIVYVKKLCPNVPIIFDTVDLHFLREARKFNVSIQQLIESKKKDIKEIQRQIKEMKPLLKNLEIMEINYMKQSNITFVVSSKEFDYLKKINPSLDIRILSNIYHFNDDMIVPTYKRRKGAIFVGNVCHKPNRDAVTFILRNILNNNSLAEDFKMHFVWSKSKDCPNSILNKAEKHEKVVVHKDITNAELARLHDSVQVVLAPLRYGAGVKGKVNYALMRKVPVIATNVAAEGMNLVNEKSFLRAETGGEFVSQINRLSTDEKLWEKLRKEGIEVLKSLFSREVASKELLKALKDLNIKVDSDIFKCPYIYENPKLNKKLELSTLLGYIPYYPRIPFNIEEYISYYN